MTNRSIEGRFKLIVTVELILLDKNNVLLMRRHGTGWQDGSYSVPGGCVDGNESVTSAVIREAREEVNIVIKPEWLIMGCVMHSRVPTLETVDFFFICKQWEGTINNNEPHKHDDLRFFPIDELPQPLMSHSNTGLHNALKGTKFVQWGW